MNGIRLYSSPGRSFYRTTGQMPNIWHHPTLLLWWWRLHDGWGAYTYEKYGRPPSRFRDIALLAMRKRRTSRAGRRDWQRFTASSLHFTWWKSLSSSPFPSPPFGLEQKGRNVNKTRFISHKHVHAHDGVWFKNTRWLITKWREHIYSQWKSFQLNQQEMQE